MRLLITGGSKSGKSMLAQRIAKALARGPLIYWATMEPTDGEDLERIKKHREERAGWGFETVECGRMLDGAPRPDPAATVLFDSVTALFTNELFSGEYGRLLFAGGDKKALASRAEESAASGLLALSGGVQCFIAVADDVFRAGDGDEELTELWMRGYAGVLRRLAAEFDAVLEVSCGEAKLIKGDPGMLDPAGG